MTDMRPNDFYTIDDVAERLRISKTTVFRLLDRKELPGYKIGGQWRISPKQLDNYLESVENGQKQESV
jgi:putative molybdopterin biosynthesis protein